MPASKVRNPMRGVGLNDPMSSAVQKTGRGTIVPLAGKLLIACWRVGTLGEIPQRLVLGGIS